MMERDRWERIERLYHAALERGPDEREAYLDEACAGDDDLRREVAGLLASDDPSDSFIQSPAIEIAARALAARPLSEVQTGSQTGPPAPRRLGAYQLLEPLGRGGMGEVYLALDSRLGRKVAVKLLPARFTADGSRVRRFAQEARAASALNHPNIITIHEIGEVATETGTTRYIVTEYVEGETLRQQMTNSSQRQMKPSEAIDVASQIAAALAAAHEAGIVHRDIKPENVMVRRDRLVKVLDFGLAKLADQSAGVEPDSAAVNHSSASGVVMGTPRYMSPEQARGEKVDARTDLFSLGVLLYEMIAGRRPFEGRTPTDVILAVVDRQPPPLAEFVPAAPDALQQIIDRALQKDRAARYQSASDLLSELQQLRRELGAAADPIPGYQPTPRGATASAAGSAPSSATAQEPAARTGAGRATATAETRLLRRARGQRRLWLPLALVALALLAGLLGYFRARPAPTIPTSIDSVAVLPFVNVGADAPTEYLADGLTESLIDGLAQLPRVKVIARGSVFRFKNKQADPRAIGRQLGVSAVLTGRVGQRGDQLTVSAELMDVRDGSHIWGAQYERRLAEIFAVQEEITRRITAGLRLKLTDAEAKQLGKRYTESAEAYQLYLKGRYFFLQFTAEGARKALDHFHQAIALDSNYALAFAGIGYVYATSASQYEAPGEGMRRARQAALRALALDETLPEAHFALALVKWWADWDWLAADSEFKRAIELSPNYAPARATYAEFLATQERFPEALAQAERALELDPLTLYVSSALGKVYYYARQYDQALAAYQKTLELDQNAARTYRGLGRVLLGQGRHAEAIAALRKAVAQEQHHYFISDLGHAYAVAGRREEARQMLAQLHQLARQRYVSPVYIAKVYAGLRETEPTLAWLERGYQDHSDQLTELRVNPAFDNLRADPRFADLLRRIGLAQ